MATAFKRLRPLFRERGQINAEVTGRLAESLGGVRIVKAYTAEKREETRVRARARTGCSATSRKSMTGVSAVGAFSARRHRRDRHRDDPHRRIGHPRRHDDDRRFRDVPVVHRADGRCRSSSSRTSARRSPKRSPDSIASARSGRWRPKIRKTPAARPLADIRGEVEFHDVTFEYNPGVPVLKHVSFHAPAGSTTALVGSSGRARAR